MRKIWILVGVLIIAVLFSAQRYFQGNPTKPQAGVPTHAKPTPSTAILPQRSSIFIPYWSLGNGLPAEYDRLIYFGITPSATGIARNEVGYTNLTTFTSQVPQDVDTLLTLRMLNNELNFKVLDNRNLQRKIIEETVALAKEHGFKGVVLDLELKALPFESLMTQINTFVADLNTAAEKEGLSLSVMQYGDTFYRVRPFNVSEIAKHSDEIMIMAYDFHKSGGSTPGPNFPLYGSETYGYDYTLMTEGFLKAVPAHKLTVVFGYFGYDWPTDEKGVAVNAGAPFSYNEIAQQYLSGCDVCTIKRDALSGETKVTYTSGDTIPHVVWFEDEVSIQKKKEFLQSKGVTSYSYWAYSYF